MAVQFWGVYLGGGARQTSMELTWKTLRTAAMGVITAVLRRVICQWKKLDWAKWKQDVQLV